MRPPRHDVFLSDTQDNPDRNWLSSLPSSAPGGRRPFCASADPERRALAYLGNARVPCVLVDRTPTLRSTRSASTIREAMEALVEHVAGLGHRRIGYVGGHPGFQPP